MIIIGAVIVILGFMLSSNEVYGFDVLFSIIGTGLVCIGIIIENNYETPTALDVYQGKTTLEITYRDSIPVDTIVIFKN